MTGRRRECPGCGQSLTPSDAAYCPGCGTPTTPPGFCSGCGAQAVPGARFCASCGAALTPNAPPSGAEPRDEQRPADAERRLVSVLFADAQGSTALMERIGDEAAYRLMQGCVNRMADAVERHEGTVTQFRGDGIMALFGAPVAHEDSTVRAVSAALDMQEALTAFRDEVAGRQGEDGTCHFRVGVHTGPIVVGHIHDSLVMDYTAIGDTANVAARLEQAADAGTVFVSEATWRAVRDFIACEEVGDVPAKGKSGPVRAYRAIARTSARSRLDAARSRGLSPFVGRDQELALLDGFVQELSSGTGRAVVLVGEAGIGKSRLFLELRDRLPDGVRWFQGQCSAMGQGTPWLPIIDLLKSAFGIEEHDGTATIARKLDEGASRWSPDAGQALPYLRWLLHAGDEELEGLDPRERRAGAYEALRLVVRDAAARAPLVVAVEDLHWADEASQGALSAVAEAVADVPVLLLMNCRPGDDDGLGDRPWYTRIPVNQLAPETAARLAADVLGAPDLPAEVEAFVAERSEGNPLFVEEVTASLLETGAIRRVGDRYELAVARDSLDIPGTLHEVILARIDRLDREAREALQLAAVIGREFTQRVLDRVAALPAGLDDHLSQLQQLELIRQTTYFPELAYLFKHALTHDVAYSTLLGERRQVLHRLVAEAIEELYEDRLVEHCESLARHWAEAGEDERALGYSVQAAEKALAGFAVPAALEHYGEAVRLAERLGDDDRLGFLLMQQATTHLLVGALPEAEAVAVRITALGRSTGTSYLEAIGLGLQAVAAVYLHRYDDAEELARAAMALPAVGIDAGQVLAAVVRRLVCDVLNRHDEITELEAEVEAIALAPLGELSDPGRVFWSNLKELEANWRGRWDGIGRVIASPPAAGSVPLAEQLQAKWVTGLGYAGRGDYDEALALLHGALHTAERVGEVFSRARILNTVGWIRGDLGDLEGGIHWNRRCLEFIAPQGIPGAELEANARLNLADVHVALGELDRAEEHVRWVEGVVGDPTEADRWMLWRYSQRLFHIAGELCRLRGDHEGALSHADECTTLARQTASPKNVVKGLRLRGQVLTETGRLDEADESLAEALETARELGNPPQLWRTLTATAALRSAQGHTDAARQHALEALEVLRTVAEGLGDESLRQALLSSVDVVAIRRLLDDDVQPGAAQVVT